MKKVLSVILSLVIMISFLPLGVFEIKASAATEGYYTYKVSNNEATITDVDTSISGDITIPSTLGGYSVGSIGESAFRGCELLTGITIPNSVTSIGDSAFYNCTSLKSITIGDSVESIGNAAFSNCNSLKSITIPNSVTSIGAEAFCDCDSLESIIIPNSVESIGYCVFYNCDSLESITIPDSVRSIGEGAFCNCLSLTTITIGNNVTYIDPLAFQNTAYYNNSANWENNVLYIGNYLIEAKTTISGSYTIKEGTKDICTCAFFGCTSLENIIIPDSVTSVGEVAFRNCTSLESITIPDSVKIIGYLTFDNCISLKNITIPNSVTSIGNSAFSDCTSLESIILPTSVVDIEESAFSGCTAIKDVWYLGSIEDRMSISLGGSNGSLTSAKWHYNSCPVGGEHSYDNDSDESCNNCNAIREVKNHKYDNPCDGKCNICGDTRVPSPCVFENACDPRCNICGDIRRVPDHRYDNACDSDCNECGDKRNITHKNTKVTTEKATLSKDGYVLTECSVCGKDYSKIIINKVGNVSLSAVSYTYNGKVQKPSVTVKDSKGKTISSKYYTVTYASGRKYVGKYKVTVKFKGNYSGTKTLYFEINPGKTTLKKVTGASKSIKVTVNKKTTQVSGYQVQYSTSKKFTSAKTKTITSAKTTSATIKSLKAKKTYYVRVRTYKTVSGKKYYSGWSTYKSTKTK